MRHLLSFLSLERGERKKERGEGLNTVQTSAYDTERHSMSDSVEADIAAAQAARKANKANRDSSTQRESDKASLSIKNASYDSDIYGGRGAYDTSIAVGGQPDEDLDDSDKPVRLVDSCKSRCLQIPDHPCVLALTVEGRTM